MTQQPDDLASLPMPNSCPNFTKLGKQLLYGLVGGLVLVLILLRSLILPPGVVLTVYWHREN